MKLKDRPLVGLLIESSRSYGRALLRGIGQYARNHTNWSLLHQEMSSETEAPTWLESASICGILARIETEETARRLKTIGVPTVDLRCRFEIDGIPRVETDDALVAQLALEHLRGRGFQRMAFCGYESANYSQRRLKYFRSFANQSRLPLCVYESPGDRHASTATIESNGLMDEALCDWLKSLQAPTGLFVCNDIRGQQVLNICRTLGISVPDEIGVIGVDNDDVICPICDPPLSSVCPDAEGVGYRAAELLNKMLRHEGVTQPIEFIPPSGVVERASTRVTAVEDREVARACQYIRENACEGITVLDVAEHLAISRRQLERRFRIELDCTPHDEITSVRIVRIKQLLRETDLPHERIASLTGYAHAEQLSAVFKRETGITPSEYRRSAK